MCGFAISLIFMHYYYAASPSSVVFWSLCQSVTLVSPANTAEMIKLPFGFRSWVGLVNHVLYKVQTPAWEGVIFRGNRQTIVKYRDTLRSSVQTWLNRLRFLLGCGLAWTQGIVLHGVQIPLFEGAILMDRGAHCKL